MGVSLNGGTPKSSIFIGFSIINHPFWGTTISGNNHFFVKFFFFDFKCHWIPSPPPRSIQFPRRRLRGILGGSEVVLGEGARVSIAGNTKEVILYNIYPDAQCMAYLHTFTIKTTQM